MIKYNRNIFNKINSEDKAYWLGFITADGYIHKNKHMLRKIDQYNFNIGPFLYVFFISFMLNIFISVVLLCLYAYILIHLYIYFNCKNDNPALAIQDKTIN